MKLITPSALVERLKINASLARAACKLLAEVTNTMIVYSVDVYGTCFLVKLYEYGDVIIHHHSLLSSSSHSQYHHYYHHHIIIVIIIISSSYSS